MPFKDKEKAKEYKKSYGKKYYQKNKEKTKKRTNKYYWDNIERERERRREYKKEYDKHHKTERKLYAKNKRTTDIQYKLACVLRERIRQVLRDSPKSGSAVSDLGCTVKEFKKYLESKFENGMSWNNYGIKKNMWSIDHIKPLSKFDLTSRKQFLKACHYTNMQPMWHIDNMKKGNKI